MVKNDFGCCQFGHCGLGQGGWEIHQGPSLHVG